MDMSPVVGLAEQSGSWKAVGDLSSRLLSHVVNGDTNYAISRFVFQRLLAFIYFIGFLILVNQFKGLSGANGLLPVRVFLKRIDFWDSPSLFWWGSSDRLLMFAAYFGLALSFFALLGLSDGLWLTLPAPLAKALSLLTWFGLWLLYLSFVNVGQTFYGFGWEMLLLETGFLAIFLGPLNVAPSILLVWLLRWLLFRVMFGAGLIKIRGDSCWRDLTCLQYHYETQPSPNPLSWFFHRSPDWMLKGGVLFNHFVELLVPFAFFGPRRMRLAAGLITIVFQTLLILSGNLSWLNCITIVLCFSCFDDRLFLNLWPALTSGLGLSAGVVSGLPWILTVALTLLILFLSYRPALNLLSSSQLMNSSFDPLHLVNTYGAFGSITRDRDELVIEGTADSVVSEKTKWLEYGFKAKPGDPLRRPPQVTPYHYKLDWQMWFAAMSPYYQNPWILNLLAKILQAQPDVLGLLKDNPFATAPPHFVRIQKYRYRFTKTGEAGWWKRELVGSYLPPLSLEDPEFHNILVEQDWLLK